MLAGLSLLASNLLLFVSGGLGSATFDEDTWRRVARGKLGARGTLAIRWVCFLGGLLLCRPGARCA
jgi:hypothetical protein